MCIRDSLFVPRLCGVGGLEREFDGLLDGRVRRTAATLIRPARHWYHWRLRGLVRAATARARLLFDFSQSQRGRGRG